MRLNRVNFNVQSLIAELKMNLSHVRQPGWVPYTISRKWQSRNCDEKKYNYVHKLRLKLLAIMHAEIKIIITTMIRSVLTCRNYHVCCRTTIILRREYLLFIIQSTCTKSYCWVQETLFDISIFSLGLAVVTWTQQ